MSMNIHLRAELQGEFTSKNGKKLNKTLVERFDCIQTPTSVTKEILKSENKYDTYTEWIKSVFSEDKVLPIYAEDDIFAEGEPIGFEKYNVAENHIKELNKFIEEYKDWDIIWFEL